MKLNEICQARLDQAIAELDRQQRAAEERLKALQDEQRQLEKRLSEAGRRLRGHQANLKRLEDARIIRRVLSEAQNPLRQRLAQLKAEAARDDITVRRSRELTKEIDDAQKELQRDCSHRLVFGHDGYQHGLDDNYMVGYWICAQCGLILWEGQTGYAELKAKTGGRIFLRPSSAEMDRWPGRVKDGDIDELIKRISGLSQVPEIINRALEGSGQDSKSSQSNCPDGQGGGAGQDSGSTAD